MGTAVIVEAVRTPIGKRGGALAGLHPAEILGAAQTALVERAGIGPASVEQVAGGCVTQAGEQAGNITRTAWLHAGLPYQTGCLTLDAQCGSAQQATHLDRRADRGRRDRRRRGLRGGGDEPGTAGRQRRHRPSAAAARLLGHRHAEPVRGRRADRAAARAVAAPSWTSSACARSARHSAPGRRAGSSGRSCRSRRRWSAAMASRTGQTRMVDRDEGLRETSLDALARLRPVLPDGMHTAGTSSQISDGAAAVLLVDAGRAAGAGPAAARADPGPVPRSGPSRTTTWTGRSRRPSGCSRAAA